jgi:hypothetical protein
MSFETLRRRARSARLPFGCATFATSTRGLPMHLPNHDRALLRRKALHAAASVVLAAGISACLLPTDEKATDDSDLANLDTEAAETDRPPADTEALVETATTTDSDPVEPDPTPVETDLAAETGPDCTEVDPAEVFTCCELRATWCAGQHPVDQEAYNACQFGPGFDGSTGCIPWGPPAPPPMRLA